MKIQLVFITLDPRKSWEENVEILGHYDSFDEMMSNYQKFFTDDCPMEFWALKPEWAILKGLQLDGQITVAQNELEKIAPKGFKSELEIEDNIPEEIGPHLMIAKLVQE